MNPLPLILHPIQNSQKECKKEGQMIGCGSHIQYHLLEQDIMPANL